MMKKLAMALLYVPLLTGCQHMMTVSVEMIEPQANESTWASSNFYAQGKMDAPRPSASDPETRYHELKGSLDSQSKNLEELNKAVIRDTLESVPAANKPVLSDDLKETIVDAVSETLTAPVNGGAQEGTPAGLESVARNGDRKSDDIVWREILDEVRRVASGTHMNPEEIDIRLKPMKYAVPDLRRAAESTEIARQSVEEAREKLIKMKEAPSQSDVAIAVETAANMTDTVADAALETARSAVAAVRQEAGKATTATTPDPPNTTQTKHTLSLEIQKTRALNRQTTFGGYATEGIFKIGPGDAMYRNVLRGRTVGEPISYVSSGSLGDSTVMFVQESPAQIRIYEVKTDATQLASNVMDIMDQALSAYVKYAGITLPSPIPDVAPAANGKPGAETAATAAGGDVCISTSGDIAVSTPAITVTASALTVVTTTIVSQWPERVVWRVQVPTDAKWITKIEPSSGTIDLAGGTASFKIELDPDQLVDVTSASTSVKVITSAGDITIPVRLEVPEV